MRGAQGAVLRSFKMKRVFLFLALALVAASWAFAQEGPTVTLVNNTGKTISEITLNYSYNNPNGSTVTASKWISPGSTIAPGGTVTTQLSQPLSVVNRYDVELKNTDGTTTKIGTVTVSSNLRMELGSSSSTASVANTARSGAVALRLGEGRTVSFRGSESLWYSVDITQNNTDFVVQTNGDMDSLLTLYNSSGERIDSDDDSGDSLNARISRTLSSGKYYIEVKNYNN
jgi:hypothetical protein